MNPKTSLILAASLCAGLPVLASAQSFQGLGDLAGGVVHSEALGISGDGSTVVGWSASASGAREAFRWTPALGMQGLGDLAGGVFDSVAYATSFDGGVVVGASDSALSTGAQPGVEAFRWEGGAMTALGDLGGALFGSGAYDVSADGSVVVGFARSTVGAGQEAFRWTELGGLVGLGVLVPSPPGWTTESWAVACSADGAVVVGNDFVGFLPDLPPRPIRWTSGTGLVAVSFAGPAAAASGDGATIVGTAWLPTSFEAYRWSPHTGIIVIGDLPGGPTSSAANDVSADGEVIVGRGTTSTGSAAFVWDSFNGIRDLRALLTTTYGLNLFGWQLTSAEGISDDGRAICGIGVNPAGNTEAWLAVLPESILPRSFCNGDGGDQAGCTACPCLNESAPGTIGGCLNSAGAATRLTVSGSPSTTLPPNAVSDLRFTLSGGPAASTAVLLSGDAVAPTNTANPCFGLNSGSQAPDRDGLRCAVQSVLRHGNRQTDANGDIADSTGPSRVWGGEAQPAAGIAVLSGFAAGQTRYFQVTHRDDPTLVCMRGLNTSQAVEVSFTP